MEDSQEIKMQIRKIIISVKNLKNYKIFTIY